MASANPAGTIGSHLPEAWPEGRVVVVGAGKAAASMAAAVEDLRPGLVTSGLVVVPYGYAAPTRTVRVLEAGHPVPDEASVEAARAMLDAVRGLTERDLVIALISGGGSACMALPAAGLSLAEKQAVNRMLLESGLDIRTMNAVRRRLSAIKGGQLAAAAGPAQVLTLAISDIPGDDIAAIASGPTIHSEDRAVDYAAVISKLGYALPATAASLLLDGERQLAQIGNSLGSYLVCTPLIALRAAAKAAEPMGFDVRVLGDDLEGESAALGSEMAASASQRVDRPTVFLSGGETTVSIGANPPGRGGRNTEFALAFAISLRRGANVWMLAADTDGEDGFAGAAGAITTPATLRRAVERGLDPESSLLRHDSASFFAELGDLVITGPTRTNVNDFRAILVLPDNDAAPG